MNYFLLSLFFFIFFPLLTHTPATWPAAIYFKKAIRQNDVTLTALRDFPFKENEQILDIGCGPGNITAHIAENISNGSIIGIDTSPEMITFAKQHYKDKKNISFQVADVTKITYQETFDMVVAFFCLHWITDQKTALQKMVQSLKSQGKLFIIFTTDNDQPLIKAYYDTMKSLQWHRYFENYTFPVTLVNSDKCVKILEESGCDHVSYTITRKANVFSSGDIFFSHLQALPIGTSCLPPELHREFVADVINNYYHYYPKNDDGSITYICPYCIMYAEKA